MAATSLLKLNLTQLLEKAEELSATRLPRGVLEVSLEPKMNLLCIRFAKPKKGELAEPLHPLVHVYRDSSSYRITAVELLEINKLR